MVTEFIISAKVFVFLFCCHCTRKRYLWALDFFLFFCKTPGNKQRMRENVDRTLAVTQNSDGIAKTTGVPSIG